MPAKPPDQEKWETENTDPEDSQEQPSEPDSNTPASEESLDNSIKAPKLPLSITKDKSKDMIESPIKTPEGNKHKANPKLIIVFAIIAVVMLGIVVSVVFIFMVPYIMTAFRTGCIKSCFIFSINQGYAVIFL